MELETREAIQNARQAAFEKALGAQTSGVSRRRFLELLGASLALAGSAACAPPRDQIVPYVRPPEDVLPGRSLYFATAHLVGGFADGVLVESTMGRPIKIEGNPQHPASLGGTDAFAQAAILDLYHPSRAQALTSGGQVRTWTDFLRSLRSALAEQLPSGGAGLRILTESVTSPTFGAQIQQLLQTYPNARWHRWQAINHDNALAGAQLAFGQSVASRFHFDTADVVLSLDADPVAAWEPGHLRAARELASRRQPELGPMSRLYAVESTWTGFGAIADHRIALPARAVEAFAWGLAAALGVQSGAPPVPIPPGVPAGWIDALAGDLRNSGQRSLVLAGRAQPPVVHAIAHAINAQLGGAGTTIEYTDQVEVDPVAQFASLVELTNEMAAGQVQLLLVLGGNPAYTAPADVPFAAQLANVAHSVYLGMFDDETAGLCQWHVPELHPLETWSDARSCDGTATVMQPLIAPLYQGWSAHELIAALSDRADTTSHGLVRNYWQPLLQGDADLAWRTVLHDGVVPNTGLAPRQMTVRSDWASGVTPAPAPSASAGLEIVFRPDEALLDGRYAHNGWLMELPRPFTRLSWDNVALVSPATARQLGVSNEDVVELGYRDRTVRAPIWVLDGHADGSIGITLGYGRRHGAAAGNGVGFDANVLRTSSAPWFDAGLEVVRTGARYTLASTQGSFDMHRRDLVRSTTADQWQTPLTNAAPPPDSLYPPVAYPSNAWGMVIDQSACTGCNACIVACQAENNIPVVGKEEVARGRDMHWLRLDTYFEGDTALRQLVPCMQCENAPCEVVCPVGATVHSDEGLNDMVYNRCVGTRYCSNNCPYKVRRFNFFQYTDFQTPVLKMLRNPQVTVRERGVMEKCTYCVQRISEARIQAERENRPIADREVVTACQAACPSGAIVFGNLNDASSGVARAHASPRNYALLAELNTRPRTTYQAVVRNPNPALGGGAA